jgi:hypothetical protein
MIVGFASPNVSYPILNFSIAPGRKFSTLKISEYTLRQSERGVLGSHLHNISHLHQLQENLAPFLMFQIQTHRSLIPIDSSEVI